ncbi:hypothetical protein [Comamonas terrae]|uniref:DUF4149 domain-containing protein n=1 Tax=Comamonas terrae TaxID=673548 RepID=A0ABW5ULH4_9BURK|nr:hypothetical protein [Comamonas terrae]
MNRKNPKTNSSAPSSQKAQAAEASPTPKDAKNLHPKLVAAVVNFAMWCIFCMAVQTYRNITLNLSFNAPMNGAAIAALTRFVDGKMVFLLFVSCLVLFAFIAFVGHKFAVPEAEGRVKLVLNQVLHEAASVFQNIGSLLLAIAYFATLPLYALAGAACWIGWLILSPKVVQTHS